MIFLDYRNSGDRGIRRIRQNPGTPESGDSRIREESREESGDRKNPEESGESGDRENPGTVYLFLFLLWFSAGFLRGQFSSQPPFQLLHKRYVSQGAACAFMPSEIFHFLG